MLSKSKNGRIGLAVCATNDHPGCQIIANVDEGDVSFVRWVNDQRLFFRVGDLSDAESGSFSYAVNVDGSQLVNLHRDSGFLAGANRGTISPRGYYYYASEPGNSNNIVMTSALRGYGPAVMNTVDGNMHTLLDHPAPTDASFWILDMDMQPRIAGVAAPSSPSVFLRNYFYRPSTSDEWQPMATSPEMVQREFVPQTIGDQDILFAHALDDDGYTALYRMQVNTSALPAEPIVKLDGFDLSGSLEIDRQARKVLGAHIETDGLGTIWFDKGFRDNQAKIDKLLPYTMNRISCGNCSSSEKLVVSAYSDREAPVFYLYDPQTEKLTPIGASRPLIKAAQMGHRDFYRFNARDGLSIPIYVTTPPNPKTGPWPTVVLIHDGPWMRGAYGEWEPQAEFLASRGYLVLEPQYRGSQGFGARLQKAGYGQWGKAIQDDIADSVKWSIDRGWTDAKRVAAGGTGYGGFVTMMALARNPELFRCGFQSVGLTNVADLFERRWDTNRRPYLSFDPIERVGDPVRDADALAKSSPLANASLIHQPLLMAYLGRNSYTNQAEGERMRNALTASGNNKVEWLFYKEEASTWGIPADAIDYWTHVEKFLDANLKNPAS